MEAGPDMKFCRRCGTTMSRQNGHVYICTNGHTIYANASPAVALILENDSGEIAVLERAKDPGKAALDLPGGFCDGAETLEAAVAREIHEEIGLNPDQYTSPQFVASGIDSYDFGGETLPVLSVVFHAVIIGKTPKLTANDDAASAQFMHKTQLKHTDLFFPSLQTGFKRFISQ
jgi:ADP-ribose pyrophosphatase YjhB (NUDIX family)